MTTEHIVTVSVPVTLTGGDHIQGPPEQHPLPERGRLPDSDSESDYDDVDNGLIQRSVYQIPDEHITTVKKKIETEKEKEKELELEPPLCSMCKEIMYQPQMLSCGHSFCYWCSISMETRKCPECRSAYEYVVPDYGFGSYIERCFPNEIKKRINEMELLMNNPKNKVQFFLKKHRNWAIDTKYLKDENFNVINDFLHDVEKDEKELSLDGIKKLMKNFPEWDLMQFGSRTKSHPSSLSEFFIVNRGDYWSYVVFKHIKPQETTNNPNE